MWEILEETLEIPENFDFPFPPYDIQNDFMKNIYSVIENGKLGIFESPTGTGKSLSIICGSIKWLKDHNEQIRTHLNKKIDDLQVEKEKLSDNSNDWLSSQSKEIEITRKLNLLKIDRDKIISYDKKIEDLKNLKEVKKKKIFKKNPKLNNNKENNDLKDLEEDEKKNIEDEDIIIEENQNLNSTDDNLSDNEKDQELKYHPTKIFICSRTHSQLSQFIGEIKKSPHGKNIRVISLASRQNYCINRDVTKLKSMALINERCLDMQKASKKENKMGDEGKAVKRQKTATNCKCKYYKQGNIEELKDWALLDVQDVEDLIQSGKELDACPYYASRLAQVDSEVVLIPYNTLLHRATREANGIQLKNNVVIIDEAHNLLEALAQMYNSELNYNQLRHSLHQLKCYKQKFSKRFSAKSLLNINQLIFVITKLQTILDKLSDAKNNLTQIYTIENFVLTGEVDNFNMFKLIQFCKDTRIAQKIRGFSIKYPLEEHEVKKPDKTGVKSFLASLEKNKNKKAVPAASSVEEEKPKDQKNLNPPSSNPLLAVISFLESLTYSYEDGRILLTKHDDDKNKYKMQFLLLNPSSHFGDIVRDCRSVIVAGGTMKPNAEFRDRLFIGAGAEPSRIVEFSCDHIIPPQNILPIIVTKGSKQENLLFNFENRFSMGESLKSIIQKTCSTVQGGIVVFFPSYKYENWFWDRVKNINFGRNVYREPQSTKEVDSVLDKYAENIRRDPKSGAMMFSVVGGKLSEGLNFSDDLGRCVIVVGLPYANILAADLKEKMTYLDKNEGQGAGKRFYENQCMKAVNQCIGRAVRHKDDYATVLLLDERYNRSNTKNGLPGWIKRSLTVQDFDGTFNVIQKFFGDRKK